MRGFQRRQLLAAVGLAAPALTLAPRANAGEQTRRADFGRLSLNESAEPPSSAVKRAIAANLDRLHRYVDQTEVDALSRQIAKLEGVDPEQVVLGEVLEPLGLHLAGTRPGGGEFVYSTPGYTALIDASAAVGGKGVGVPLNTRLENDLPALAAAIGDRTLAVSLVNPHNPSGTLEDKAAFDRFIEQTAARTLVVVDEAYLEYDDLAGRSAVRFTRTGANVLTFRTLAKAYGLAGLSIGYALAPLALARSLRAAGVGGPHAQNRLGLVAAAAALDDRPHLAAHVRRVHAERERLHATLDRLGLRHTDSRANFIFFESTRPADTVRARLAESGLKVGRAFPPLDAWIRITVGTTAETDAVIAALDAIYR
jgi:histidinol-phosphate aminotransferase